MLIELFLEMLAAERGASREHARRLSRDLADLLAIISRGTAPHASPTRRPSDVRAYLATLAKRGFASASVARRLSAMRQLYRFLYAEGQRADDPSAIIEGPQRGRAVPKVLSIAEVDRLLTEARADITQDRSPALERLRAARLACLLEVLYATGLRVSELVAFAGLGGRAQCAHAHRARQGRQGAAGAAQ